MNGTTIGIITGSIVAVGGSLVLYSGVVDAHAAEREKSPSPPSARFKETIGSALLVTGVSVALGSGLGALGKNRPAVTALRRR